MHSITQLKSFIKGNGSGDCGGDGGSATLNCRNGYPCIIECGGSESCGQAGSVTINCNDATTCTLVCQADSTDEACSYSDGNAVFNCGSSACLLQCNGGNCGSRLDVNADPATAISYSCSGGCNNVNDPAPFTTDPTMAPSTVTTNEPTKAPSKTPSASPSQSPTTSDPTSPPSSEPSKEPSTSPTRAPVTSDPTSAPSKDPTDNPSVSPSEFSSEQPTNAPSNQPSQTPSSMPSANPSTSPSENPSSSPSKIPSMSPSSNPSQSPTQPTFIPSKSPLPAGATYPPSEDPSVSPNTPSPLLAVDTASTASPTQEGDGSVDSATTDVDRFNEPATAQSQGESLQDWMYIAVGCGSMVCCLVVILILFKCNQKRRRERNIEDKFRFDANKGKPQKVELSAFIFVLQETQPFCP